MTDVEAAWVGAMIEGEGTIYWNKSRQCYNLAVANTEVETIATVLRFTNDGGVYSYQPTQRNKRTKRLWVWAVTARRALVDVLQQVIPYLTGKQEYARTVVETLREV